MNFAPVHPHDADARVQCMLDALERERADWAGELHDRVLQGLAAVTIGLSPTLRATEDPGVRETVRAALDEVRGEIDTLRRMIDELHPAELDALGLEAALRALARRTADAAGIHVDVDLELDHTGGMEALTVFRIVQEALANVSRHAQAASASVLVHIDDASVHVTVRDDGRGFAVGAVPPGFGLVMMRERVAVAHGELQIRSDAGGTTVTAELPRLAR
jgi:signal transduction histidine kinase